MKKVINIIAHQPPYHYFRENKPPVHFVLQDGQYVGIWQYDIPNLFAFEIIKYTSDFEIEIWQPDYRADHVYSHEFIGGVTKKQIPSKLMTGWFGLKKIIINDSTNILKCLDEELKQNNIVIHLHGLGYNINEEIIRYYSRVPKVINFHSKITSLPFENAKRLRKNIFANLDYYQRGKNLAKNHNVYFTYNNSNEVEKLYRYNAIGIERIFTGVDFNLYTPCSQRATVRQKLHIQPDEMMLFMGSRFEPIKQIDRVIDICKKINDLGHRSFKLCIAGHGSIEYERHLRAISEPLLSSGQIRFLGYKYADDLLEYYQAADLFLSSSLSEGGPTSAIKAMACEVPIFCTRVKGVDDFLAQANAGILVNPQDYGDWMQKLIKVLNGYRPGLFDREQAKAIFDWPQIAQRYIEIYNRLFSTAI